MITFSIITVTYQAASVLQSTLDSILSQTYPHVEHIIIDGASTDDTLRLATEYQDRNKQAGSAHSVSVVSEPDKGLYDAMNKGIRSATGDYLVFLNAGDVLPSADTLESVAAAALACHKDDETRMMAGIAASDGTDAAVLYGDTELVDEDGDRLGLRRGRVPDQLSWRSFRRGMLVCHQAFYVRTDIAKQVSYDLRYRYSADVDWCIRVMKEAERQGAPLLNVHAVIALFLVGGMSTSNHRASLKERWKVMCKHYGVITTAMMHLWFALKKPF